MSLLLLLHGTAVAPSDGGLGHGPLGSMPLGGAAASASAGTATGSWSYVGTAAGARTPKATATGTFTFTGAASGKRTPKANASGSWSFAGAASGKENPQGAATGVWSFTGAAAGVALLPPTGITATPVSSSQLNLSWNSVSGATGYDIERNGVVIVTDYAGTSYSDTGLAAGTAFTYRVRATA